MTANPESLLNRFDQLRRTFTDGDNELRRVLVSLSQSEFKDADSLVRFHEALLFVRTYPPSARVSDQVDEILQQFDGRISNLPEDTDLSPFDDPEVSGIAGGS